MNIALRIMIQCSNFQYDDSKLGNNFSLGLSMEQIIESEHVLQTLFQGYNKHKLNERMFAIMKIFLCLDVT